eukprot:TRINITY_DN2599_c0_g1_i10.p1 TRINITY_DN2599_c0_g1~~TRINITY_DN2599_c0_g1_i10.p1  ORF type:complete len:322 (+),score=48.30 TRINITY_DN2599_c0_g1_i10:85-966(+)
MLRSLVGSEMCIRDRSEASSLPLDALLSQRMHTPGNAWLAMWEAAPAVEPASVFVPESILDKLFSWLGTEASQEEVHLVVVLFNASNLAHRVACHPACITACLPPSTPGDDQYAVLQGLLRDKFTEMGKIAYACTSTAAGLTFSSLQEVEAVRGKCSQLVRCVRDLEYVMGLVMACGVTLHSDGDEGAQVELTAIATRLACATYMDRKPISTTNTGGKESTYKLSHTLIPPHLFWGHVLPLLPSNSAPVMKRSVLRCLAERPMNSEATPQRLLMDVDANGLHRVAFCLAEEIP